MYLFWSSKLTDRDGTIDMVFATCSSVSRLTGLGNNCYVNVAYNKQLPLCASTTSPSFRNGQRVCRAPEELCIADSNFTFDLSDRPGNDVRDCDRDCGISSSSHIHRHSFEFPLKILFRPQMEPLHNYWFWTPLTIHLFRCRSKLEISI